MRRFNETMPFSSNNGGGGGPWGGGSGNRGGGGKGPWGGGGGGGPQGPDLDDLLRKGRDQLKVVLGGKGGGTSGGGRRGGGGPGVERLLPVAIPLVLAGFWLMQSFYSVKPEEKSVELFFGEFSSIGEPGLNFAPWPFVTYEKLAVTQERIINIGKGREGATRGDQGLMLTGDENIVDIDFQVVWNIDRPDLYLFNLAEPTQTIQAVSESAMREVVARSNLATIITTDRFEIARQVRELVQSTLDSYDVGVRIVRVNYEGANPPEQVIDAFRDVQAADQDRRTEANRAEAYANQKLAGARGQVAQLLQEAEGYRAQVVNEAKGEAARFESVYSEYVNAPEVTRKRLYLETIERVLGDVEKVIIDDSAAGSGAQGVVPYLPLNELRRGGTN